MDIQKNNRKGEAMNEEQRGYEESDMNFSIIKDIKNGGLSIRFEDGRKVAEFVLPEISLVKYEGFEEEEIEKFIQCLNEEKKSIIQISEYHNRR